MAAYKRFIRRARTIAIVVPGHGWAMISLPRGTRRVFLLVLLATAIVLSTATANAILATRDDTKRHFLGSSGWPSQGQAAYLLPGEPVQASADQSPAPIASVAKVMTAYVVLQAHPLHDNDDGFTLTVTRADVDETAHRRDLDESIVEVRTGEQLTERQALAALLLPSANNIAAMLAKQVSGSIDAFTSRMNHTAHTLRMWHTTYTDPSGYDSDTRSTAADQLILAKTAMSVPAFAGLVALKSYPMPFVGAVHNTDSLLGQDGFVGVKTGSMDASGGCFMFATRRVVDGQPVMLYGVVLGQHGHNLITAGLTAARQLADRVAPQAV